MNFNVYVPSRGRARMDLQYTIKMFSPAVRAVTNLVVRPDEVEAYTPIAEQLGVKLVTRPEHCQNLSQTLDWIIHEHAFPGAPAIMLDDDLRFSVRIDEEDMTKTSLRLADQSDVDRILVELNDLVRDGYPMAGVSARFGNNNLTKSAVQYCGRQMQVHAVDPDYFRNNAIHPGKVVCKSDFFMTLSVLTSGSQNAIICWATVDQAKGSNSEGGVSVYRDFDTLNDGAETLRLFFPKYVKVVLKTTKWKGIDRPFSDVRISWRKAYEESEG